jgi:outer membrane receptor protein involved in Fe transport
MIQFDWFLDATGEWGGEVGEVMLSLKNNYLIIEILQKQSYSLGMNHKVSFQLFSLSLCAVAVASGSAEPETANADSEVYTLPSLTVRGQETANVLPASTFESVVSNLDFDPRIDFQSRNMAEAQGDVSIRGGIFEGTGIQVGAATLLDPQTGHYSTELPIAPEMLGEPKVLTGADNALYGFNSTAGTLSYQWSEMSTGGSITIGGGENELNFQRLHSAWVEPLHADGKWKWGYEAEYSRSESDGTVAYSDHDFSRVSARVQLVGPHSQTDLFAGYQSKFFGQEGMYVGFKSPETEYIKTRLFILNHRLDYAAESHLQATAYFRRNSDHYNYDRFLPDYEYIHDSEVSTIALAGLHGINAHFALNYNLQLTYDTIDSTTLEQGKFSNRRYYKLGLVPQYSYGLNDQREVRVKAGLSFDDSSRNNSEFSPMAEISLRTDQGMGNSERLYLSYAETTQLAGYSAIGGSEGSGYWLSNHNLLRETAQNIELGYGIYRPQWSLESAIFYRWDEDLVDWAYAGLAARSAVNVDLETFGFEIIATRYWDKLEAIASYSFLQKSDNYNEILIKNKLEDETIEMINPDGSFYALNFPNHRATLGFIYTPNRYFEIRLDNEWRQQEKKKTLRRGTNRAIFSYIGISYFPKQSKALELFLAYDKPWQESFEEIPRTPGRSEQLSLGLTHQW